MNCAASPSEELLRLLGAWYQPLRQQLRSARTHADLGEDSEAPEECQCSERFLQILWNEQRLSPALHTLDGRAVEVISPGTWNVAGGPDFHHAVVRLAGRVCRGAIEVHREAADWWRHGHAADPAYAQVVLHVVWRAGGMPMAATAPPILEMGSQLDGSLRDLIEELQAAVYPYARQVNPGVCAMRWALTEDDTVRRLLRTAALARFEDKTMRLQRHGVAVGPGQAAYEAVFEALGYKANRVPFRALAQQVSLRQLRQLPDPASREAALFGAAGLLPDPSTTPVLPEWLPRVRELWDQWWTVGGTSLGLAWHRAGTRPLNSPHRRLAAGTAWLNTCGLDPERWIVAAAARQHDPAPLVHDLRTQLNVHSPWEPVKDCTVRLPRPARLLGEARTNDILANVLLPYLNAIGSRVGDASLCRLARDAFLALPRLQDNRVLQEAAHRFLVPPSRGRTVVQGAADQQGLIELYRCFCLALNGDCGSCPFTTAPAAV